MPNIIKKMLREKAVYWPLEGTLPNGQPKYGEATEIKTRWEFVAEEYVGSTGNTKVSRARIFVPIEIPLGSAISRTPYEQLTDLAKPYNNPNTWRVEQYNEQPSLRYQPQKTLRWVMV